MFLEHSKDLPSAKWDSINNKWNVEERKKYRWLDSNNTPVSEWMYTMSEVLNWIIEYDNNVNNYVNNP